MQGRSVCDRQMQRNMIAVHVISVTLLLLLSLLLQIGATRVAT
jgi:hypothetical protein